MVSSRDAELRALRERAYGPDADIHDDPVALARLRQLEADVERVTASEPPLDEEPESEPGQSAVDDDRTEGGASSRVRPEARVPPEARAPSEGSSPLEDGAPPDRDRVRVSRRVAWLWAASAALALFAGAGLSLAIASLTGDRVAVLPEADLSDWPSLSFGEPEDGSRLFDDYLGLTPVIVPSALGSDTQQRVACMFVVILSDYDGGDPPGTAATTVTAGCADGAFAPVASFTVTDASPEALREEFPVGTSVRFTVEGDEAHVTVRRP